MKIDTILSVIISQPLSVMQSYDAKQVEANLKLAGFDRITIEDYEEENTKTKTLAVKASRPNQREIQMLLRLNLKRLEITK